MLCPRAIVGLEVPGDAAPVQSRRDRLQPSDKMHAPGGPTLSLLRRALHMIGETASEM